MKAEIALLKNIKVVEVVEVVEVKPEVEIKQEVKIYIVLMQKQINDTAKFLKDNKSF